MHHNSTTLNGTGKLDLGDNFLVLAPSQDSRSFARECGLDAEYREIAGSASEVGGRRVAVLSKDDPESKKRADADADAARSNGASEAKTVVIPGWGHRYPTLDRGCKPAAFRAAIAGKPVGAGSTAARATGPRQHGVSEQNGQARPGADNAHGSQPHTRDSTDTTASTDTTVPALRLVTTKLSKVRPKPIKFLDGGIIPVGKLVTIAGLGGAGKGMLLMNLAADLSKGRRTFGLEHAPGEPIEILLVGCEDGYEDTVAPRLLAADANIDKIEFLERVEDDKGRPLPFSILHLGPLDRHLQANPNVRLVIIDPITGFVGRAGIKDNNDAELRRVLEPLVELAGKRQVTIIIVKHLNKDEAKTVASRVGGSIAYVNVPRACYAVASDPHNEMRRMLAPFKWNLNAPRPKAIAFTMEPAPDKLIAEILESESCKDLTPDEKGKLKDQLHRLKWEGETDVSADDLLRTAANVERKSTRNEIERAEEFLRDFLSQGPKGSIHCAQVGDVAIGRRWPPFRVGAAADERERCVLGRAKWWRETILKPKLGGQSSRAGYGGPYFFHTPGHTEGSGLWPPPTKEIQAAQQAAEQSVLPQDDDPVEAVVSVEAVKSVKDDELPEDSTARRTKKRSSKVSARAKESIRESQPGNQDSTDTTDTTGGLEEGEV